MRRVIEGMLLAAMLLDAAYWLLWATRRDWIASAHTPAYYAFENAFPLADLWLGLACLLALVNLRRRRPAALLWLLAAGSAGLYLGCMDLLYDLRNDIFTRSGGGAVEAVVVLVTWVFSVTALRWSRRHRAELLADSGATGRAP